MPIKTPPSGKPDIAKSNQKLTLSTSPGLKDYFNEQEAVAAKTAKLRALRLAKEAEAEPLEAAAPKRARARQKPAVRRGIGSN